MITEQTLKVLDQIEALTDMILESRIYHEFKVAEQKLNHDAEAHLLYQAFLKAKDQYDDVQRFGKYHPDYQQIMLETRKRKRAYEMVPCVIDYKKKETELQSLIDQIIATIAYSVSEHVKIEAGNPFFQYDKGGCASGGSCKCSL
ncbi:YlbF family regulator [Staphylococcus sp. SQ8-PEA]|uniref:YlbF family regulator n=1 Tax=Staphylococcus marylandisciuri TaxID=2981529 RepID=A0ABT2QNZ7_9STAP|nr:YlbF family regulator [Staphylococcus marylandisciuri]MCU5745688.1 YlbF family regulator [Staphylococcus marylandisciuri]